MRPVDTPLRRLLRRLIPERAVSRLGLLRDALRNATFRAYVATHSYGGVVHQVRIADGLGKGWYDFDWAPLTPLTVLREQGVLVPGARAFDLGAHQGIVAMMLADVVGPTGLVVAVEATRLNADLARENASLNGLRQVTVLHAAAAETPGVISFAPRSNGHVATAEEASVEVRAVSVDELSAEYGPPSVVMIDVEGYELHTLRGARATLVAHRPALIVEVHVGEGLEQWGTAADVIAMVPERYRVLVSRHENGPYVPLAEGRTLLDERFQLLAIPE
ncbi:MAG: FkbM family methyltransferase [Gemmatimonadaceae bacterium]|nr:FkbM family methyltransferase [Gemmatimonadaceae bacterium]